MDWPVVFGGVATAAGTAAWAAVHPAAQLFGPTLTRLPDRSTIALTFDDGPNPSATPYLLDILERHGATATFFLIGSWVRRCPSIVRAVSDRGHAIGNHTDTHPNLVWLSPSRIATELERCQDSVAAAAGYCPGLVRPPYGYRGPQLQAAIRRSGLTRVVLWSVSGRDWSPRGQRVVRRRIGSVRGGDIVLLHDGSHTALGADRCATLRAVDYWLPRWRDAGLKCVALTTPERT